MKITTEEYFFYEWLILNEQVTSEEWAAKSRDEKEAYVKKYLEFRKSLWLVS